MMEGMLGVVVVVVGIVSEGGFGFDMKCGFKVREEVSEDHIQLLGCAYTAREFRRAPASPYIAHFSHVRYPVLS
jgi:hypothetical protein